MHTKVPLMLTVLRSIAFAFILAGSFYFGYVERPVEMGLAIVAGSIALAFSYIDKIASFKGAGFEATMHQQQQLATLVAKATEQPKPSQSPPMLVRGFSTDEATKSVLKALGSEKYTWRYLGGIAEETQLPKERIRTALSWLVANELATETEGAQGPVWGLSSEGRSLLASIQAVS